MFGRKGMWTICVILLTTMLLCCLTACGKSDKVDGEVREKPTVLTNVYEGEEIQLPENYSLKNYLGMEDGNLVFLAQYFKELVVTEDDYQTESWQALCTMPLDGGEMTFTKLEGHMSEEHCSSMILTQDGYMGLDSVLDDGSDTPVYSLKILKKDGSLTTTVEDLERFFDTNGNKRFTIDNFMQDGDGYTYLFADKSVVILQPDYSFYGRITLDGNVQSIDRHSDGTVYVQYTASKADGGRGQQFIAIDRENKTMGDVLTLPSNVQADVVFFGEGYDLYYADENGIYGYNEGDTDGTMVMDFQNSDISPQLETIIALGAERFLLTYYDKIEWGQKSSIFTKVGDVDLSQITVLEVATNSTDDELYRYATRYNQRHKDIRIVITNYSQYNTEEDSYTGNTRLAMDVLNGLYKPDMIVDQYVASSYRAIIEQDLFLDLTPYLEKDTLLPLSELFGCVTGTYQKDGKIFALPTHISASPVIANKSMVGNRDGWTVEEMLDLLESLPTGVSYMTGLSQQKAANKLLGAQGYNTFIDWKKGKCSFDSDTFIRFLEYIKTLPTETTWKNREDLITATRNGEIVAVDTAYLDVTGFVMNKIYFGEDNISYVGKPTEEGKNGVTLSTYANLYTILADSQYPDECWEFIRDLVLDVNTLAEEVDFVGLPMLRSTLEDMKEYYKDTIFLVYYTGSMSYGGIYEVKERDDAEYYQLTEADWEEIENMLDSMGTSIVSYALPEEVKTIIDEELSAYLGGANTAKDCAKAIQSRVKLYLDERH